MTTPNTNDYVPWGVAVGANVMAVAAYQASVIRQQGAQIGIADPVTFNNAMRQATTIAAMIGQFTADYGPLGNNVQDNGDIPTLEAEFVAALTALIDTLITPTTGSLYHWGGSDSGSANAYVLTTPSPALASYVTGTTIALKPAHTNTGGSTVNVSGLGVKTIVRIDGSALQAGDLNSSGIGIMVYDGAQFVLTDVLQTISGVPVATTTANGVSREATNSEMTNGVTAGSTPAFVTPEGLPLYSELRWTYVFRSTSHTETAYNELILLTGSSNFTTTLETAVSASTAYGYEIYNASTANQNIATAGGIFINSDLVGGGGSFLVIPPGFIAKLKTNGSNWSVLEVFGAASVANRGVLRIASNAEGTAGVTSGSTPAAMTPEDTALFFFANVANTSARGIARQATTTEMNNGATSGSSPAFVTPEGLGNANPFIKTGPGAVIVASPFITGASGVAGMVGTTFTWGFSGGNQAATVGGAVFNVSDARWPSGAAPGVWVVAQGTYTGRTGGGTLNSFNLAETYVLLRQS